jgi:hypothetical protein
MTNLQILADGFLGLTKRQRRNLKYHLDKATPIFCGPGSDFEYAKDGKV